MSPSLHVSRVHLDKGDLSRVRIGLEHAETLETMLAIELLPPRRGGAQFTAWRRRTIRLLGHRLQWLATAPRTRPFHDFRPVPMTQRTGDCSDQTPFGVAVREFHRVAISPFWKRIRSLLEEDRDARGRLLLDGGLDLLMSTLHATITWNPSVLTVSGRRTGDLDSHGQGLLLSPSLFLTDSPLLLDPTSPDQPPILVYPAATDPAAVSRVWSDATSPSSEPLSALIGGTRAAILQALTTSCSTTELARRVRTSAATASRHAAVLRSAGLVTTQRRSNLVMHTLTPLGLALLHVRQGRINAPTTERGEVSVAARTGS